jgi:hypothetical protein
LIREMRSIHKRGVSKNAESPLDLQGVMSIGPLSIPNRLKQKLQEMPSMLRQRLPLVESTVPSLLNGNIYRVDCCMAGEEDYNLELLENSWVINEMQLVLVAQTFITSYHHNGPQANQLADGLVSYIVNRIQAMVPLMAPLFGVIFLRGHIFLKNWTYCPLLRESASPFKSTCLLITLK